jgi:hypothetical protein
MEVESFRKTNKKFKKFLDSKECKQEVNFQKLESFLIMPGKNNK